MTEILTESFCERCGTRYTFEPVKARRKPLSRIGTLGRGIRHFVSEPGSSLDEAFAVARSEQEQRSTANALEAFHRTFNFCLSCRQYTCADCWNTVEGRCLSCAPTLEAAPPATRVDIAVQLPPMDLAPVPAPTHIAPEVPGAESGSLDLSVIRAEAKALAAADAAAKGSAAGAAAADWARTQALADAEVAAEANALAAEAEAEAASLAIVEAEARARVEAEEAAREVTAAAEAQARAEAEALANAEAEEAAREMAEAAAASAAEAHAIAKAEESARADAAAQRAAREMAEAQAHAEAEALVQAAAQEAAREAAAEAEAREAEAREAAHAAAEAQAIADAVAAAEAEARTAVEAQAALQARAAAARANARSEPSQTVLAFEPGFNLDDQIAAYESKLAGTPAPPAAAAPAVAPIVVEEVVAAAPAVAPIVVEEVVAAAPAVAPIANEPLSWPEADAAAAAFEPHWPDIPIPRQPTEERGAGLPAEATAPPPAAARACPSCGLSLSANARFCRRCGTPQEVANTPR